MRWAQGLLHCVHGVWGVLRGSWRRGRGVLVFTHAHDMNAQGADEQMGPLLEHLRATGTPVMEISLVPLAGLARARRLKPSGFVSWAVILAPSRLLAWVSPFSLNESRVILTRWLLRLWRPKAAILIDESGSGQPIVRAARDLGIPTLGVQHGDFTSSNPQYAPLPDAEFDRVPVDCLCLWSQWFQRRLLSISPIYSAHNTCVTGRLRTVDPLEIDEDTRETGVLRVLAIMENDAAFDEAVEPYLQALESDPAVELLRREHPARSAQVNQRPLREQLLSCDVVFGVRSSALWEAVAFRLPVVVPMTALSGDRGALADAKALAAESPAQLLTICSRILTEGIDQHELAAAYRCLWGDAQGSAAEAILEVLHRKFDLDEVQKTSGLNTHAG